jgi:hypothetical protein
VEVRLIATDTPPATQLFLTPRKLVEDPIWDRLDEVAEVEGPANVLVTEVLYAPLAWCDGLIIKSLIR